MEEEIDIEEHDVLDNPKIRTIFPDLTQIKAEIPDDDFQDPDLEASYLPYSEAEDDNRKQHEDTSEYPRVGNKIILGSKPSNQKSPIVQNNESLLIFGRKPIEIKKEVEGYEAPDKEHDDEEKLHDEQHSTTSSVLIVGSKPPDSSFIQPTVDSEDSDEDIENLSGKTRFLGEEIDLNDEQQSNKQDDDPKDPTKAFVLVENWEPRLKNSMCYCKECQILFPTSNTLLSHNMTTHSFLVAVEKNKAVKSTAKAATKQAVVDSGKFCNHCNKMFPDSDSLITHLYQKLTFDKNKAVFKQMPKKVVPSPFHKPVNLNLGKDENLECESESQDSQGSEETLYYRCSVCSTYFGGLHGLKYHMFKYHSVTNFSKKKTAFDGACAHCSSMLGSRIAYRQHLKKFHSHLLYLKADKLPPKPVLNKSKQMPKFLAKQPVSKYSKYNAHKFKCLKCHMILSSYDKARSHRRSKHPDVNTRTIFVRVNKMQKSAIKPLPLNSESTSAAAVDAETASASKKVILKYPLNRQTSSKSNIPEIFSPSTSKSLPQFNPLVKAKPVNESLVPKSILFKCNKCQIHYTSCSTAVLHIKNCKHEVGDWKCQICKREFQRFDQVMHKMQHEISKKFKVVECYENIYGNVLNHCPKCKQYFHEKQFYLHERKSACKGTSVRCNKCNIPIHVSSVEDHEKWHERTKYIKKEMILVEFVNVPVNKPLVATKRVLTSDEQAAPPKKAKIEQPDSKKQLVRYCAACDTYMFQFAHLSNHQNGKCVDLPILDNKNVCTICGLTYTSNSHCSFHKHNPEITLMDMKFADVNSPELIAPRIPDFPKCDKCHVHFCRKSTVDTHNCKDSYKTCKNCKKRFSDLAYKLHVRFHDYHARFISEKSKTGRSAPLQKAKVQDSLPELLKKYNMLTNTWNILFLCVDCDIAWDSYDKAVDHCQKHYNNMEYYDMIVQSCDTCNLKLDATCFDKHVALHTHNEKLNKQSFTIVSLKYKTLLKRNYAWLEQFKSLPETQLQQIMSRSIYCYNRSVKLRVVQEGAPEATIYRCGKCEYFIHPLSLGNHYKSVACRKDTMKYRCNICSIPFSSYKAREKHQEYHETIESFRIVYFNEDGDEEFNQTLRENNALTQAQAAVSAKGHAKSYVYYMCVNCKCCIGQKDKARDHTCSDPKLIERCNKCQLHFFYIFLRKHLRLHEFNPNFVRKNIKLIPFKPKQFSSAEWANRGKKDVIRLYKCPCELHFTSTKASEKHLEVCGTDSVISKEKCSKCDLLFDTTQLVTHLCKHHSNHEDINAQFEVVLVSPNDKRNTETRTLINKDELNTDKRKNLYKCQRCDVYYLSPGALSYHFVIKHQVSKVIPCRHCKLKFMPSSLKKHIELHHRMLNCKVSDFKIYIGFLTASGAVSIKPTVTSNLTLTKSKPILTKYKPTVTKSKPTSTEHLHTIQDVHRDVDLTQYNNELYKCTLCGAHFLTLGTLLAHRSKVKNNPDHQTKLDECKDCGYNFPIFSLLRHRYIHHETMHLKRDDLRIKYKKETKAVTSNSEATDVGENVENSDLIDDTETVDDSEGTTDNIYLDKTEDSVDDTEIADDTEGTNDEIYIDKTEDTVVEKISIPDNGQHKTFKYTNIVYKCDICGLNCFSFTSIKLHLKSHLTNTKPADLVSCFCGLRFTSGYLTRHENRHHIKEKTTLEDFYIITIKLYGDSVASTEYLFRCGVCGINYQSPESMKKHALEVEHTSTQKKECPKCGLLFSVSGIESHLKNQHEIMKLNLDDFIVFQTIGKNKVTLYNPNDKLEKYHENDIIHKKRTVANPKEKVDMDSDTRTLHKCNACNTNFLNTVALNSHQNSCQEETNESVICEECDLQFAKYDLKSHIDMHHKNMAMKQEDFNILQYDTLIDDSKENESSEDNIHVEDRLTGETSPSADISDIANTANKSLPPIVHHHRMLYKCNVCSRHYLHRTSLRSHLARASYRSHQMHNTRPIKSAKKACTICGLEFPELTLPKHMFVHHRSLNFKRDDFHIVTNEDLGMSSRSCEFGYKEAKEVKEINEETSLIDNEDKAEINRKDVDSDVEDDMPGGKRRKTTDNQIDNNKPFIYFRCAQCKCCLPNSDSIRVHYRKCKSISPTYSCEQCQLQFLHPAKFSEHMELHEQGQISQAQNVVAINYAGARMSVLTSFIESLSLKTRTETMEDKPIPTMERDLYRTGYGNKLYKCNTCCLYFFDKEMLDLHIWNPKLKLPRSTCTQCGLAFANGMLPTHVYYHHETDKDYIVISKDEVSFYSEKVNAFEEFSSSSSSGSKAIEAPECSSATLVLDSDSSELKDDRGKNTSIKGVESTVTSAESNENSKCKLEHSETYKNLGEGTTVPSSSKVDPRKVTENTIKLYKCAACNVCFLSQTSCYKHAVKHVTLDPKDYIECKLCGYQFLILNNSLLKHITKHHDKTFKPEDVLIEEYHPDILCHGTPKIEIYFGNDVQSKLVSTTSDANYNSELSSDNGAEIKVSDHSAELDLNSSTESIDVEDVDSDGVDK